MSSALGRFPHGVVLPKAESGADIAELAHRTGNIPIHAIVTETPASLFGMLSYRDPKTTLAAMRRILRKIAEGETSGFGDTSTLADPTVVDSLLAGAREFQKAPA